ncbi:MAG: hypothetical protein WCW93_03005 [Candidatus Paceibacterota bacterium]
MQTETKNCKKCKQGFVLNSDDFSFYKKMKVPIPKVCPDCRFKMRALFRNETTLYSGRKCALCGKNIISVYNPKSPYIIYCHECFYSEKWEPRDYAINYDENKSFLDQFKELLIKVPKMTTNSSLAFGVNIRSEYINLASGCKDCYMVFNTGPAEEILYSRGVKDSRYCTDIYFGTNSERCYENVNVHQSSGILWGQNVNGSVDSSFVLNCRNLVNCFGCVNLNNKSYHFLNQPVSPAKYKIKINEILGDYKKTEEFKKKFEKFVLDFPMRENNNLKSVNSTGDYLVECKNTKDSFENRKGEDCRYIYSAKEVKDSIGIIGYGFKSEHLLESVATGYSSNIVGSFSSTNSSDILYGFEINNCKDCIGCDSIKNGKYFILNKQYEKVEYERLREKIINELKDKDLYGLIIPPELAPFAYNESIAQDNFPLTKKEALEEGFRWEDDIQKTEGKETLNPEKTPNNIKDVLDSITEEILRCIDCNRNYKITIPELLFYRNMNIPIPRKCFYCRHQDRVIRRGPYKFFDRNCAKCQKNISTNYSPDRSEIIFCEKCYQQEVY